MNVPNNVIQPLGLSQIDGQIALIYKSKRRNHKLAIALGGEKLVEQPGSPLLVSSSGGHINEDDVRNLVLAELAGEQYISYSVKVGANWQWRIARNTPDWDLSLWETLPSNLSVTQGLLVSDSSHDSQALAVYVQSDILLISKSKDLSKWSDGKSICTLPYRAQLLAAVEHPLGIAVVYAHQTKRGRTYRANIHTVIIDREELNILDQRKNICEIELTGPIADNLLGAELQDKSLNIFSSDKKNRIQKFNVPFNIFRKKDSDEVSTVYVPHRPELVEVLPQQEPMAQPSTNVKVLMFGWELPPHHKGGLGIATYGLAKALLDHGAIVNMILPREKALDDDSISVRFAGVEDIKIQYINSPVQPYISAEAYEAIKSGKTMGFAKDLYAEVLRYAELAVESSQDIDFDVIHTHDWLTLKSGVEVKKASGKPLIAHIHSTSRDMAGGGELDMRIWEIEHEGLQHADKIIAVSKHTKNTLVELHGLDPDRIEVVYNGIDCHSYPDRKFASHGKLEPMNFNHNAYKMVLFFGRLTRHKGPEQFLNMAEQVLKLRPHTHFVYGGTGDQERRLIERAAEMGISSNIHFAGWVSGKDLTRLYRSADLYILPSVSEPFGITPMEALINGTPVMVSNQSGISEVLASALKVDFWDVDNMTQKTIAALDYPWLHKQLAEEGLAEVRRLTWRKAASNTLDVYHEMLSGSRT